MRRPDEVRARYLDVHELRFRPPDPELVVGRERHRNWSTWAGGLLRPVLLAVARTLQQGERDLALAAATDVLGLDPTESVRRMSQVTSVSGRYEVRDIGALKVRLLLAKNPASWTELLSVMPPAPTPVMKNHHQRQRRRRSRSVMAVGRPVRAAWGTDGDRLRRSPPGPRRETRPRRGRSRRPEDPYDRRAELPEAARSLDVIDCAATYTAFFGLRTRGDARTSPTPAVTATVCIVSIYATLLGTYGDAGNVQTLRHQTRLRGIDVDVVEVAAGEPIPASGDLYVLGGRDTARPPAARAIREDGSLHTAVDNRAAVLAVCAGYQLLGEYFPDGQGQPAPGLDLIDIRTDRLPTRAVGELAADPVSLDLPRLSGYENHGGATHRGPDVAPLARVLAGVETATVPGVPSQATSVGTYLHGPGLARNPGWPTRFSGGASGRTCRHWSSPEVEALREERLRTVLGERWNS